MYFLIALIITLRSIFPEMTSKKDLQKRIDSLQ